MPLYFLFMRGWVWLGETAFVLRYPSLLFGLLAVPLIYQIGRFLGGVRVGQTAAFLLAVSPFHIWYSQEARMYTLLLAALLLAHVGLLWVWRGGGWRAWLLYGLGMLTAVYTHYFTFLIFVAHYLFFVLTYRQQRRRFWQWLATASVVGLFFLPWFWLALRVGNYTQSVPRWIEPIQWYEPLLTWLAFAAGRTIQPTVVWPYFALGVYGIGLLLGLRQLRRGKTSQQLGRLLLCWLLLPLAVVYLVSLVGRAFSIYLDRYLQITLPALVLVVSLGVAALRRELQLVLLLVYLVGMVGGLFNLYFDPHYARTDWQAALAQPYRSDAVFLLRREHRLPFRYYGGVEAGRVVYLPPFAAGETADLAKTAVLAKSLAENYPEATQLWLVSSVFVNDTHGFPPLHTTVADPYRRALEAMYPVQQELSFTNIVLTQYNLAGAVQE